MNKLIDLILKEGKNNTSDLVVNVTTYSPVFGKYIQPVSLNIDSLCLDIEEYKPEITIENNIVNIFFKETNLKLSSGECFTSDHGCVMVINKDSFNNMYKLLKDMRGEGL